MIIKYFFSANKNIPRAVTLHPEPVQKNWTQKGFHKCYAHKWSQINKFYLRSFFDYDFNIVKTGKDNKLHIQHNPATNNPEITCHLKDQINDTQIAFQMPWNHIVFYSEETCFLEMQNCYEGPKNLKLIEGKLDTSKWVRPIQPAFITESLHQRINIKRGDILCQLSFYSPNIKEKIVLECQDNPPQKIVDLVNENTLTTRYVKNTMSLIDRGAELLKSALKK